MMQLLSTEVFDQVNAKNINLDIYSNHSPMGCFSDVDLDI